MRDLTEIVNICKNDMDILGIKYGKVRHWSVNTRAKRRLGMCQKAGFGMFDISISAILLEDQSDIRLAMNTVMHELLHTVSGCFTHKGKWKALAEYINKEMPQYNITRTVKYDSSNNQNPTKEPIYRYILKCTECGQEIKRQRKSNAVKNYKHYRCGKCKGKLKLITLP